MYPYIFCSPIILLCRKWLDEKKPATSVKICVFSPFFAYWLVSFICQFEALSEVAPNFAVPHIFCEGSGNKKMQAGYWKSWDFLRFLKISKKSNKKVGKNLPKIWFLPQNISLRIKIYFFPGNYKYFLAWEVLTQKKYQFQSEEKLLFLNDDFTQLFERCFGFFAISTQTSMLLRDIHTIYTNILPYWEEFLFEMIFEGQKKWLKLCVPWGTV